MTNNNQTNLIDELGIEEKWKEHWKDMPEFVSENKKPLQQIKVSFRSYGDVKEFAKLLGLNVTPKTDGLWFPMKDKEDGFIYKSKYWNNEK